MDDANSLNVSCSSKKNHMELKQVNLWYTYYQLPHVALPLNTAMPRESLKVYRYSWKTVV